MLAAPVRRPSGRVEFEQGMSYAPRVTLLLILANVAVFGWEASSGALTSKESIIGAGALWREGLMQGEVWRLFTAMFLHGGADHLIGNCVALYVLGMACEHAVGSARMLAVYLLTGVVAGLTSAGFGPGPSVGASGAIFGIWAATTSFLHQHRDLYRVRDKRIFVVLLVWAGYTVLTGLASPYIDNSAHVGGFAAGWLVGRTLDTRLTVTGAAARDRARRDWR
jgi:rhomboid protease GluP